MLTIVVIFDNISECFYVVEEVVGEIRDKGRNDGITLFEIFSVPIAK